MSAAAVQRGYTDAMVSARVWTLSDTPPSGVTRDDRTGFSVTGSLWDIASAVSRRFPDKVN